MSGWGMGWGMGWVIMTLVLILIGWGIWLGTRKTPPSDPPRRNALDVLDQRYASGEIDTDEYLERRQTLGQ